jgi:hypothetical protein
MNAIKRLGKNQKPISPKSLNHKPKDVTNSHIETQLMELNETTR